MDQPNIAKSLLPFYGSDDKFSRTLVSILEMSFMDT
jgi:hypothetical protein